MTTHASRDEFEIGLQDERMSLRSGDIINTCRLIEGPSLDILESREIAGDLKNWAVGPLIPAKPASNSSSESRHEILKWMGVPIAAWPMHSDQPSNAILVTEILKVGLPVRMWGEVVTAEGVEDVVRRLIESDEGGEIRKRAEEVAAVLQGVTEEGGASRIEMDSFIAHITRQDV